MTVQPNHRRMSAEELIREALDAAVAHPVVLSRDATYTGREVMTLVEVPVMRKLGALPGQRWAFRVSVVLLTTGPGFDEAAAGADEVADALLSLTAVDGVRVSSVVCDSEPVRLSPHTPTGAETLVSRYSAILRREGAT